jgi:hypothetical protein
MTSYCEYVPSSAITNIPLRYSICISADHAIIRIYPGYLWHDLPKYILSLSIIFFFLLLWYFKWILDIYCHSISPRGYAKMLWIDPTLQWRYSFSTWGLSCIEIVYCQVKVYTWLLKEVLGGRNFDVVVSWPLLGFHVSQWSKWSPWPKYPSCLGVGIGSALKRIKRHSWRRSVKVRIYISNICIFFFIFWR